MRNARGWFTCAAGCALLVLPSIASAQACVGVPTPDRTFAIIGEYQTTDGVSGYGGTVSANLAGPLTVQGGYMLSDVDLSDENGHTFGGRVAYEIPNLSFSACPFVGVEYSKLSMSIPLLDFDMDIEETVIPIGVGIGYTMAASPTLGLTAYAMPQFLHIRGTFTLTDETGTQEESDSTNEFGAELGLRLGTQRVFGGAGVLVTTVEESDAVLLLSLGFAVGGAR